MARSTVNVDVQVQTKSINDLENELSAINEELKGVAINSKAFKELSTQANGLTKELNKANSAAEGFTDDKKFMAADGAIKAMAGSVSGVVGALGLLGVESEAFGEMEKKAASAIAVSMGIKGVSEGFNQLRKSQVLATAAQKAYSVAVTAGNKIMKLFNITMALNPIGVLIAALATVGGLIYAFRDSIMDTIKNALGPFKGIIDKIYGAFTSLGEALGLVDDAQTKLTKDNVARMERELQVASAKGDATIELEKKLLLEKRKLLKEGTDEYEDSITQELVLDAKATKQKEDNEQALADKRKAIRDKDKADKDAKAKEDEDKEKARVESIAGLLDELETKREDKDADTREKQINLEEERKLEDLERLAATDAEIQEAKDYYESLRVDLAAEKKEEADEKEKEETATKLEAIKEQEAAKISIKKQSLQTLSELFGQETALGKVALLAKQAMLVQEMIMTAKSDLTQAKSTVTGAVLKGAEAQAALAAGTAETSKVGFPQNIPLLIGYAAQAAGIIGTVKSAVSKSKQVAGGVGATAGAGGGTISAPSIPTGVSGPAAAAPSIPPQPSTVNQSVRAYVVSGDVNSAQEADARLDRRRSLG